ncbi:hypothetical protein E4100_00555 [Soehngenia longivitae]|uniref:HTH cro/C1-type domain-containing protein n=1 Tax=Soehngenia longivitae TaxID=2562294 RepID=A0A4Z0D9S6_9FIRM|nr:hypothetical protein E4100_00555 [Soehngenia longivitae]
MYLEILRKRVEMYSYVLSHMNKDENVSLDVLYRICDVLYRR